MSLAVLVYTRLLLPLFALVSAVASLLLSHAT